MFVTFKINFTQFKDSFSKNEKFKISIGTGTPLFIFNSCGYIPLENDAENKVLVMRDIDKGILSPTEEELERNISFLINSYYNTNHKSTFSMDNFLKFYSIDERSKEISAEVFVENKDLTFFMCAVKNSIISTPDFKKTFLEDYNINDTVEILSPIIDRKIFQRTNNITEFFAVSPALIKLGIFIPSISTSFYDNFSPSKTLQNNMLGFLTNYDFISKVGKDYNGSLISFPERDPDDNSTEREILRILLCSLLEDFSTFYSEYNCHTWGDSKEKFIDADFKNIFTVREILSERCNERIESLMFRKNIKLDAR